MLLDVIILVAFYFVIFGIMTVQLFGGVFRNRCGAPVFDDATTDAVTGIVHVGPAPNKLQHQLAGCRLHAPKPEPCDCFNTLAGV